MVFCFETPVDKKELLEVMISEAKSFWYMFEYSQRGESCLRVKQGQRNELLECRRLAKLAIQSLEMMFAQNALQCNEYENMMYDIDSLKMSCDELLDGGEIQL